jgi:hypothetical protein
MMSDCHQRVRASENNERVRESGVEIFDRGLELRNVGVEFRNPPQAEEEIAARPGVRDS